MCDGEYREELAASTSEKVALLRAAWREDRAARVRHWRKHWFIELLEALWGLGGGFLFGVALGLAAVTAALVRFSS